MKCISCGKEVPENMVRCECGFNLVEHDKYQTVFRVSKDPEVSVEDKSSLIDNPILTFVFGLFSMTSTIVYILEPLVMVYLLIVVMFVFLTIKMSTKPSKVKLIAFRNVGKFLAYLSIGLTLFKIIYEIIGKLFF